MKPLIKDNQMKHFRSCNLCEAICGLEIEHDGATVLSIKGDKKDPFSRGHICPKAVAMKDIYEDPDRLKKPVKKVKDGWREISWDQAFDEIEKNLKPLLGAKTRNAIGVYLGNPTVHNYGSLIFIRPLIRALKTRNIFTATSVDQLPHHFAASFMFGHSMLLPIPDIDRTKHMLILGANPGASNGSLMTAPDMKRRLKAIRGRGGKVVLIDPRKTETAKLVDEHHFIYPGTDVFLLAALLNVIFTEGLDQKAGLAGHIKNLDALRAAVAGITPGVAEKQTGLAAKTIVKLGREFAAGNRAVCYGRMGVSTQEHGGLCHWLINALNIVTGNFDRAGGAMFPTPAVGLVGDRSTLGKYNRWQSRVRGLPEFDGDLPVSVLAEEILTKGPGQIKALITNAGNPVLSTPNGRQMEKALKKLDYMVSIDIYINETTRHADIILPPATGLEVDHYDLVFNALAVRNVARYSPALFKPAEGSLYDWQILKELTGRLGGRKKAGLKAKLKHRYKKSLTPTRVLNLGLLLGPYGSWKHPLRLFRGLNLKRLKKNPHGIDLGPLVPRGSGILLTPDKRVDVAPEIFLTRLLEVKPDLTGSGAAAKKTGLRLIGRRHLRSNNSWMHNSKRLVKGKTRCTIMIHPDDAGKHGITGDQMVRVASRVGAIDLPAEISRDIMPGVASIPHGYGHNLKGTKILVAEAHAGVSVNDITDQKSVDPLTGNAAFSGQTITIEPL